MGCAAAAGASAGLAACPKLKPGFTAFTAGASATLALAIDDDGGATGSTGGDGRKEGRGESDGGREHALGSRAARMAPLAPASRGALSGVLTLTYLSSFEAMGRVNVSCGGGCGCNATVVDAHRDDLLSTWASVEIRTTLHGRECHVRLTVDGASSSGGHKFKVGGLQLWRGRWRIRRAVPAPRAKARHPPRRPS